MTQVEAKNISGSTPLHVAAYYGSRDMIHLLMENGAKPLNKNKVFGCYVYLTNKVIILFILDSLRGHRLIPGNYFKTPCLKVDKCIQKFRHLVQLKVKVMKSIFGSIIITCKTH